MNGHPDGDAHRGGRPGTTLTRADYIVVTP